MRPFNSIAIETSARCNRRCIFCPNYHYRRPDEEMSEIVILHILDQLEDYAGRIVLYMYNEPLLDSRLVEIIRMCRSMAPKSCIMTSTNGDFIDGPEFFKRIFDAGLNQLKINVYEQQRYGILKKWVESIWWLDEGNVDLKCGRSKTLYSLDKKWDISDGKVGKFELSNRSGNIDLLPVMAEPIKSTCVRPFRIMQINWKGEVVVCCNDYKGEAVMGSVLSDSLVDIWNGERFMHYRRKLQNKDRTGLKLCDVCSFKGGAYKGNLERV